MSVRAGIKRISTAIKVIGVLLALVFVVLAFEYLFRAHRNGEGFQFGNFFSSLSMALIPLIPALAVGWVLDGFTKE